MAKLGKESLKKFLSNLSIVYPRIVLQSNQEAVLEGCKKIVRYSETEIRIQTKKTDVCFFGNNLTLTCLTPENVIIHGTIDKIEFMK